MKIMMDRQCTRVRSRIGEVVLGDDWLSPQDERHAAACLVCQAEVANYKTIGRAFSAIRLEILTAPLDLVSSVMDGLDRTAVPWFRRPVAVSVSAVSAVALTATVAVAMRRRHAAA